MKGFEERWAECVRVVRMARRAEADPPPSWAAIQALRRGRAREDDAEVESMAWWRWYGARGVAVASVLMVVCLVFASRGPQDRHPLRPGVEDAVSEVFWLL